MTTENHDPQNIKIEPSWRSALAPEFSKPYFKELTTFVKTEYQNHTIYPNPKQIFNAFNLCPFDKTKVVIIGQDPYHGPNQATGLAFSVSDNTPLPPSLKNIYKELQTDLNIAPPKTGNLDHWAKQGVLLLNATLTVRAAQAASHQNKGWETFTDAAIHHLATQKSNLVFILWGAYAQKKGQLIGPTRHLILDSAHPSPLSAHAGFFNSHPFSQTNKYLQQHGLEEIRWG